MECTTMLYKKEHYFPMHIHPDLYTFSYILDGSAHLICEKSTFILKPNDLVVIPPFVAHQTQIDNFFHYKVIRVPQPNSFINTHVNKLGLSIIRNCFSLREEYNKWFESIRSKNINEIVVPDIFQRFLDSYTSPLSHQKNILAKAILYFENNYSKTIHVEEMSDLTCLSESHFQRLFKQNIGISPMRYLQNLRIEKAKEYIKARDNFTDVAYKTGFFDQSHFNKYFKVNVGMIPKQYADFVKNDRILQF